MTMNQPSWVGLVLAALITISLQQNALSTDDYDADPDALRIALFNAATAGDQTLFDSLCDEYASTISRDFESWRNLTSEPREDPTAVKRHHEHLSAIARHFAGRGDRTLIGMLEGTAAKAKMLGWMRSYSDAESLRRDNQCEKAIAILVPVVEEM